MNHSAWVQTHSGKRLDLLDPQPDQFDIDDIALGLSRTARWNGQTGLLLTVAQHSLMVSENVPPAYALPALLHDASEYLLSDLPTPLKELCTDYRRVEERLQTAIYQKFWCAEKHDLSFDLMQSLVRNADARVLATEYRDLHPHKLFNIPAAPFDWRITGCMDPASAEVAFLERFWALYGGGDE